MGTVKFYGIGSENENLIRDSSCRPFVQLELYWQTKSYFIPDSDILECEMTSLKEKTGGIVNSGTILLDNRNKQYSPELHPEFGDYMKIRVWYCLGSTGSTLMRFYLYQDEKGFQTYGEGHTPGTCRVHLVDQSYFMKKRNIPDWTSVTSAVNADIYDKRREEQSLAWKLSHMVDLWDWTEEYSYLPYVVPYVHFAGTAWDEISLLATAYQAHLECGTERDFSFTGSPYDPVNYTGPDPVQWKLTGDDIVSYHRYAKEADYFNMLKLQWTHYVVKERTKLWEYADPPVTYDSSLTPSYPFVPGTRDIEKYSTYEAPYTFRDQDGTGRDVVYVSDIDSRKTFAQNLVYTGNGILPLVYDTRTYHNKAIVQLKAAGPAVLKKAVISGCPIVAEQNFSYTVRDQLAVYKDDMHEICISNKYLSGTKNEDGVPFYQRWAQDIVLDGAKHKHGFFLKTNQPLIHARVGAVIELDLADECGTPAGNVKIESLTFRYRKCAAFETTLQVSSV